MTRGCGRSVRDVSATRRAEKALAIEKHRFQALAENAPFGMVMIGDDGTFEYINPKFRELFGYDLREIPSGREWFRKAYPDSDYRREVIKTWHEDADASAPNGSRARVFDVRCKDGTTKVVYFRPVRLNTGKCILSCEDITELRATQKALKSSEQMLRTILNASPAAITYIQNGVVKWTNPAMLKMFGLEHEDECLGKSTCDFYSSRVEYERIRSAFKKAMASGVTFENRGLISPQRWGSFRW